MRLLLKLDDNNLKKKLSEYVARRELAPRIRDTFPRLLPKIQKEFGNAFRRTRAYAGLVGRFENFYPDDVPAHMGLSPSDAVTAASIIASIVEQQVEFSSPRVNGTNSVSFAVETENIVLALQNRIGENGSGIRWIDWLLGEGPDVQAQIKFGDYSRNPKSRSGRAVMITKNISSYWSSEKYDNFAINGTFLDDIQEDQRFQSAVLRIIQSEFNRRLK